MVDLSLLKESARFETDANGEEVVIIPRRMWEDALEDDTVTMQTQSERLLALMDEWERNPVENMSEEWWDEFDRFMAVNRFTIPDRDLHLRDEE
jgi:hypothetical protein